MKQKILKSIETLKESVKLLQKYVPHKDEKMHKKILFWSAAGAGGMFILMLFLFAILSIGLPDVTKLENVAADQSTEIMDREGNLLYTIHGEENRDYVELKDIAKDLQEATVSIEDDQFFDHGGFDLLAIGRAGLYEVFGLGTPRGGSTITQQYVKNAFLSAERSYLRKIRELILAIKVEGHYDKNEILELYLNRIPYGNNAYGSEKASEVYFGKHAKDLTLAESAILASLPQAPSRYNPYGNNKFSHLLKEFTPEELEDREIEGEADLETEEYARGLIGQRIDLGNGTNIYIPGRADLVLKRMYELDKITEEERQAALDELQTITFNDYQEPIKHPHFVLYVKEILEEKYGKDVVERGGLKVYTTIDPDVQGTAEEMAEKYGQTNLTNYGVNNIAALTINAKTGEILAMVGSKDYFNEEIDGNVNVVLRPRQPGSSFKPIVYAQAFYNGYAPGNVIYDVPTKIGPDNPQNYDGSWQGQITVRRALAQSRNIPAIKAYYLAGQQDDIINLASKMGISTLQKTHNYGYPLALGAGEVPLMEMVTAYSVFANNGKKPELNSILKIENANGDIIEEWKPKEFEEVMDPQVAFLINSILSDRENSVGSRLFVSGKTNAAKTGTSTKENKKGSGSAKVSPSDCWTIGYTPTIVTGVWAGNTDGTGLNYNADGYNAAAPLFRDIMTEALKKLPNESFPQPAGIKKVSVSKATGKLPGPNTPSNMTVSDFFSSFSIPTEVDNAFFTVKLDEVSGLLATEFTPEESVIEVTYQNYEDIADMFNWKQEVYNYFKGKESEEIGEDGKVIRFGVPPTEYDNVHTAESAALRPSVNILSPGANSLLGEGSFTVSPDIVAPHGVQKVEFYIDDKLEYQTTTAPYSGSLKISKFMADGSVHLIVVKVIDALGYSGQSAIEIKVDKSLSQEEEKPAKE